MSTVSLDFERADLKEAAPTIHSWLRSTHDLMRQHHPNVTYLGSDGITLAHGRAWTSVPWRSHRGSGYRRMRARECFRNAFDHAAVNGSELTYVEGLAYCGFFPVHHAWCVTPDGRVVDPTWREDPDSKIPVEAWEYVGVPFTMDFVFDTIGRKRTYGVLGATWLYGEPLPDGAIADV